METDYKIILTPTITKMDDGTIRVIFSMNEEEMVCLYYEIAKRGWTNKPILSNKWRCVEGKVMNSVIYDKGIVEPKDLVGWGQELISVFISEHSSESNQNPSKE